MLVSRAGTEMGRRAIRIPPSQLLLRVDAAAARPYGAEKLSPVRPDLLPAELSASGFHG